jgi:uncharacterized protein (DUF3084 family)
MDTTGERLTRVEESTKQAHKRINVLESEVKDLRNLTLAVRDISSKISNMDEKIDGINIKLDKQEQRVALIERKPVKRLDGAIDTIIKVVIGAVVSYLLLKMGLGG